MGTSSPPMVFLTQKCTLSSMIPTEIITEMHKAVEEASYSHRKHGPYKTYIPSQHFEIGRYASQHGATAAAQYFSSKLKKPVSISATTSIKKMYAEELRKRRRSDDGSLHEITDLPAHKRGRRKLLLREDLDLKVQLYLKKMRQGGGAVSAKMAMAAARRILRKCNSSLLAENGGPYN